MTNREKALLVDSLRGKYSLKELLAAVGMAKSSYGYASSALDRPETDGRKALRKAVVKAFGDSGGTYGYRRLPPEINSMDGIGAGEWTVRRIMREEGLVACNPKRRRKYSSYAGEVSEAPGNTCLDGGGKAPFRRRRPE